MISCRLKGGIGNRMFQIAATFSLAKQVGVDYVIDFDNSIFKNVKNGTPITTKEYNEPKFSYTELPKEDGLMLNGYFQSEKYFLKHRQAIKKLFHFEDEVLIQKINSFLEEIRKGQKIISIHVRRGDYLNTPHHHPTCSMEYYQESMKIFGGNNTQFLFVSDDMTWCKQNFSGENMYFSPFTNGIDDLYLLTKCDNHIIANSSFSWWGAYLCDLNNKVVAPKTWFGSQGPQDTQDIYLDSWIKI